MKAKWTKADAAVPDETWNPVVRCSLVSEGDVVKLHLVLTFYWFDLVAAGQKRIEYRVMSQRNKELIWDRRSKLTHVVFQRGYTKQKCGPFRIVKIDKGSCPYEEWDETYFRVQFEDVA